MLSLIGRNIARLRRERNFTQEDLAGLAEMDRSYLSNLENGKINVSVMTLLAIARALDVDITELFRKKPRPRG